MNEHEHPEQQYIKEFWGSKRNLLSFTLALPQGVHLVPIHSLSVLHLFCESDEIMEETLRVLPETLGLTRFPLISVGSRYGSFKPMPWIGYCEIAKQLKPKNS